MKVEREQAIGELAHLRYKLGYSKLSMANYLRETYDLGKTRAYELINDMFTEMGHLYTEIHDDALQDALSALQEMKQKAVGQGNDKLALEVQKEINKIQALHIQKLEIEAKNIEGININIKRDKDE